MMGKDNLSWDKSKPEPRQTRVPVVKVVKKLGSGRAHAATRKEGQMKARLWKVGILGAGMALLGGCATSGGDKEGGELPSWALNPTVENGLAAAQCVPVRGSQMQIALNQATAQARQALATQIETNVESMEKTYQNQTSVGDKATAGSDFESVSKQTTEQALQGARPQKKEIVDVGDSKQACVMVTLNPKKTKNLFDQIVKQSGRKLGPQSEKALYQQFKHDKAQKEMSKSLKD